MYEPVAIASGSLAFNSQNISGSFLNAVANPVLANIDQIRPFVTSMLKADPNTDVSAIFAVECAELMHVSSIVIHPMSFRQDGWGCNLTQMGNVAEADWWQRI